MVVALRRPCRCGHSKDEHQHYRRGTDCSGCDCVAFHGQLEVTFRFGRQVPPVVDVIIPDEIPAEIPPEAELYVRPTHSAGLTAGPSGLPAPRSEEPRAAEQSSLRKQSAG
jgi:hypothetical protein